MDQNEASCKLSVCASEAASCKLSVCRTVPHLLVQCFFNRENASLARRVLSNNKNSASVARRVLSDKRAL